MRKAIIILLISLFGVGAMAQYTSSPSPGNYTSTVSRDRNGSCGLYFHGDNMLKAIIPSIDGNKIKFRVIKYNNGRPNQFSSGTDVYIKFSNSKNWDDLLCSNDYIRLSRYRSGMYYQRDYYASFSGRKYCLAVSVAGNSEHTRYYSEIITLTKKEERCDAPNSNYFEAKNITSNSFKADWGSVSNASRYEIEIRRVSNNVLVHSSYPTSSYANITGLLPQFRYKFRVRSQCRSGWSEWSSYSSTITTLEEEQSINITSPSSYSAYTVGDKMNIRWNSKGTITNIGIGIGSHSLGLSTTIIGNTSNNGYYSFTIPDSYNAATDYRILVYNFSNSNTYSIVENITIKKRCGSPYGLKVNNITTNSATAYWEAASEVNKYKIELYKTNGQSIATYTANQNSFTFTNLEPNTSYKYYLRAYCNGNLSNRMIQSPSFTTKKEEVSACGYLDCTSGNCGTIGNEAYEAIQYLCEKKIVTGENNGKVNPDKAISRAELAAIAYRGLFGENKTIASKFPSPYNDLQNENMYYYEHAKALLYLEYDDGITPFDRDRFNFFPERTISRAYTLKVLLEAYNIKPSNGGHLPFNDVNSSEDYFGYIKAAADRGIINTSTNSFRPDEPCTRAEAFIMLTRILKKGLKPSVNGKGDFFVPGNMTPYNIAVEKGLDVGNFNHYTKNCFNIANRGIPMDFSFTYNSFPTELPSEFYPNQPLGLGWTHSYNAYATVIDGATTADKRLLIHWPNGSLNVYKPNATHFESITKGLTDEVTIGDSGEIFVKTKNKIKYRFAFKGQQHLLALDRIEDRYGNYVEIEYEKSNNKVRVDYVTDPFGRKLNFYYHSGTNKLRKVTDPLGRSISFDFNGEKLSQFTDARSNTTKYIYSTKAGEADLLKLVELPKGNRITNSYENRKLTSTQYNNQTPTRVTINTDNYGKTNANDYISSTVKAPNGKGGTVTTQYKRNANGKLTYIHDDVTTSSVAYNDSNNPTLPTRITQNGITTTTSYDNRGNVTNVTVSGGGITINKSYSYNSDNDITSYTDGNGNNYSFTYNNGNLTRATTPDASTNYSYNSHGQVTQITSPTGVQVSYSYDNPYGYMTRMRVGGGSIKTSYNYDKIGRVLSVTDAKGRVSRYDYNKVDAVTAVTNPLNQSTNYAYDDNDNLIRVANAKGNATVMTYNDDDLLTSMSFAGSTKKFAYYYDGTLQTLTKPNGQSFTYNYDALGRPTGDGATVYAYDNDKLNSISYNGKTITYGYDGLNRINSIRYSDAPNNEVRYSYDKNNNITAIIYPDGKKVMYRYDEVNRMKKVTDWNNHSTTYNYRKDGQLENTVYPNGVKTVYNYDDLGRLISQKTTRSNGTVIAEYTFEIDDLGNHTKETLNQPQELIPQLPEGTTTYAYDNGNHLQTAGDASYSFDANGDIQSGNGYNYTFDKYGKLTNISGKLNAAYQYDGLGNRRKRNNIHYILDIMGLSRVLAETDGSSVQNYYVYGLGLISRIDANNNTAYYVYDFRGSTVAITDDSNSANITHKYAYDDFGKVTAQEEANNNPFKYVGKMGLMYEDENHYFVRARYYDCNTARFISEDPIWNTNLYAYGGNNGVMNVDVDGEFKKEISKEIWTNGYNRVGTFDVHTESSIKKGNLIDIGGSSALFKTYDDFIIRGKVFDANAKLILNEGGGEAKLGVDVAKLEFGNDNTYIKGDLGWGASLGGSYQPNKICVDIKLGVGGEVCLQNTILNKVIDIPVSGYREIGKGLGKLIYGQ